MKIKLAIIAILGAVTVMLGALGSHAFKSILTTPELVNFEIAVRYQMYHVLALLGINVYAHFSESIKNKISVFFLAGIVCFSGSIYAITFGVDASLIWFVTPLGGLLFITGWFYTAFAFLKKSF